MRVARSLLLHVCLGGAGGAALCALALWSNARSAILAQRAHHAQAATLAATAVRAPTLAAAQRGDAAACAELQDLGRELVQRTGVILGVTLLTDGREPLALAGQSLTLSQTELAPLLARAQTARECVVADTEAPVQHFAAVPLPGMGLPATAIVFELDPHARQVAPLSIWPLLLGLALTGILVALVHRRFGRALTAIEAAAGGSAATPFADADALALAVREQCQRAQLGERDLDQRVTVRTREIADHSRAKDEQLANTVHELRTPLTTILASLSILDDGLAETADERQQFLHNAITATRHLTFLCNDILDTTAFESGKLRMDLGRADVREVLTEAEGLMRPMAIAHDLALTVQLPSDLLAVTADRARTLQVLFNLLGNAMKYSRPRGHVVLRAGYDRDGVLFEVLDDGIGVPAASRDKLFTKFGRAHGRDSSVAGTGIGLYLCRVLVEAMGGRIGYHEKPGGPGSVFWFTLPLHHSVNTPPIGPGVAAATK
jgi:signal transduction histidine kinase